MEEVPDCFQQPGILPLPTKPSRESGSIKSESNSKKALTNDQITAANVRLVDADGTQVGIVSNAEAQAAAEAAGMDLPKSRCVTAVVKWLIRKSAWSYLSE